MSIVRAAMVQFVLEKRGHTVALAGNPDVEVRQVRTYQPNERQRDVLYVVCGVVGRLSFSANGNAAAISWPQGTLQTEALCETYEAVRMLESWAASLGEALLQNVTLDDFMALGCEMLSCPLAYFDRNLIVLAASADYWQRSDLAERDGAGLHIEGQMPPSRAADLVEDSDYLHAAQEQGGFYYEDARNRMFYGVNTFDQGAYLARLVASLPADVARLHRGQEQLMDVYHRRLDDLYLRYAGNAGVVSSQNDLLHTLARRVVLGGETVDGSEISAVLRSYGWEAGNTYVVAKLVFFEGVHWDSVSLYLCALLERAISGSCAFPAEQEIVWLANLTRAARANEASEQVKQRFIGSLVGLLREYACKAGISDSYADFAAGRNFYLEAGFALEYGQMRDPHYWYFPFGDYVFDYVLAQSSGDLTAAQVCHPALATLRAHDARHGTEFARTLVCFLRNSQNTTRSADELYIHRTSFMRRMAQIKRIAPVDLDNPDQVLHLLLSARLLERVDALEKITAP